MRRLGKRRRGAVLCLALGVASSGTGCEKEAPAPVASATASVAPAPTACEHGRSLDPPRSEFKRAITLLRDKKYKAADGLLEKLEKKYPLSATVLVWRGDATLYDSARDYTEAATQALVYYRKATKLHDEGCGLRPGMHYYLTMGTAYAYLRKKDAANARKALEIAEKHWPNSAEVHYHFARTECLENHLDECLARLERTYELARSRQRPLFLRVHRALDDWFVRADSQSEFEQLRKTRAKAFQELKAKARNDG